MQLLVSGSLEVQPEEPALLDVLGEILVLRVDQERDRQSTVRSGTRTHGPGAINYELDLMDGTVSTAAVFLAAGFDEGFSAMA